MALQNRVSPFGDLFATAVRGLFMGNRGGRIHDAHQRLGRRRWASRQWICCRLDFKDRHRRVWGDGYTELFFLDDVTALAAGHRPCFECRRTDAEAFAVAIASALPQAGQFRPRADDIDRLLHGQRRAVSGTAAPVVDLTDALPDGAVVAIEGGAYARREGRWLRWTPAGYEAASFAADAPASLLTPSAIVTALTEGYTPLWHPSAAAA